MHLRLKRDVAQRSWAQMTRSSCYELYASTIGRHGTSKAGHQTLKRSDVLMAAMHWAGRLCYPMRSASTTACACGALATPRGPWSRRARPGSRLGSHPGSLQGRSATCAACIASDWRTSACARVCARGAILALRAACLESSMWPMRACPWSVHGILEALLGLYLGEVPVCVSR